MKEHSVTNILVQKKKGSDLSAADVARIVLMLERGGEVDPESAREELPKCQIVSLKIEDRQIVSVAALKSVRRAYNRSRSKKSGHGLSDDVPEFGYVVTDKAYQERGYGRVVCDAILQDLNGPLFATVRIDNEPMIHILETRGFTRKGKRWLSRLRTAYLGLWVR
jgi:RimJ/RimL family protein N-acetyltransferase